MAQIVVNVPDGDSRQGCRYLGHSSTETSYQVYVDSYSCQIFKTPIDSTRKKCVGCEMMSTGKHIYGEVNE